MDGVKKGVSTFFQGQWSGIYLVVLALLAMALVRSNMHLVAAPLPRRVGYRLYESMVADPGAAFCSAHPDLKTRETECNELTEGVCKDAGCCVWAETVTGHAACVAGDKHGPVYLSDPHAEQMYDVTRYVHQGQTYSNRRATN